MTDRSSYDKEVEDGFMSCLTVLIVGVAFVIAMIALATGGPITITGVLGNDNDVRITIIDDDRDCAQLIGYQRCEFDGNTPQE